MSEAKAAFADTQRRAVSQFMQGRGDRLSQPPQTAIQAPAPDAAQAAVTAALDALRRDGDLPATVTRLTADAFWRGDWQADRIQAVEDGRTILIGYYVDVANRSYQQPPQVRRFFGLIRRDDTPDDHRGAQIVLTPAGREAITRAEPVHLGHVRTWLLDALTPEQARSLGHLLNTALRHAHHLEHHGMAPADQEAPVAPACPASPAS